jgi:hypothetical protein
MYPGKTPNPQIGPHGPGNNQRNPLSKLVTDRSASDSEQPAGRSPTLTMAGAKCQCKHVRLPHDPVQNGTKCSCHRYVKPEDYGAPVTPGRESGAQRNQPPEAQEPTNDQE